MFFISPLESTTNDFHDIPFHVGCNHIIGSGTPMFTVTQSLRQLGGNGGFSGHKTYDLLSLQKG